MIRFALAPLVVAIVAGAVATASFGAVAKGEATGVLEFRGGIQAQTNVNRSTCRSGPGDSIAITLANVGGWSSLVLTASTPRPGERGIAKVSLQGTGHRDDADGIAIWSLVKKAATGAGAPVRIAANGSAGTINVTLPLASVDMIANPSSVVIALHWTLGACASA
jgi:hypothetical protein